MNSVYASAILSLYNALELKKSSFCNLAVKKIPFVAYIKPSSAVVIHTIHQLSEKNSTSIVFLCKMFHQVLRESNLEYTGITRHSLRHTAAIFNLERGGSIEQTKAMLGHVSIKSTLVYQAYLDRLKNDCEQQIESILIHEDTWLADALFPYFSFE